VLGELAVRGLTRLLVEGGPAVWRAFAEAGLFDEVVLFMAGDRSDKEAGDALRRHLGALALEKADRRPVGRDTMWRLRRVRA
jgi:diaminohydroxyphosphoribosylaminopyrimidine deaminase/5-amino-6-(5-phosphoribosylamino)uracil reductase